MTFDGNPSNERRPNLSELDPSLFDRLRRLDEPTDRSDWTDVVKRSHVLRGPGLRTVALAAIAAAAVAAAAGLAVTAWVTGTASTGRGPATMQLAFDGRNGQGVVLYSAPARTEFVDNTGGKDATAGSSASREQTAAVVRALNDGGPLHVDAAVLRRSTTIPPAPQGPQPGDQALLSLSLYKTAGLSRSAGSAQLSCQYGLNQQALCDATVYLQDGSRLTASGILDKDSSHLDLVVTSASGHNAADREATAGIADATT
jgi:hypothetical protein